MSKVQYGIFASNCYVWTHFLRANDGLSAKCKLCEAIIKTTCRSTKGLHVHLKSKHHIEDMSKIVIKSEASSSSAQSRMPSPEPPPDLTEPRQPKRKKIADNFPKNSNEISMEERVSRMTAKDGLPFAVFVTSEDLRDLFKAKGFLLPRSSTSVRMMVMNYGMTLRMKVLHEFSQLKENGRRFSLTFDEWTSSSSRRYLNINVHTYANDRALSWNIGLTRIFGSMSASVYVETLKNKLKEFDLDLDKDIVAITTNESSLMVRIGSLIPTYQQVCFVHGLQLGILNVLYEKHESIQQGHLDDDPLGNEVEINKILDGSNMTEDSGFMVEVVPSEVEAKLNYDFNDIINKVRKIVHIFKSSPSKNDLLQEYVKIEFGRKIELFGDCKMRWSSLATMVEIFNKLKLCISKTLIDLGLSTNIDYKLSEHQFDALVNLEYILKPVKLAVEVLCRQDTNLITAESTLKFMIRKLEDNHTALASELALSLRRHILQRRTNLSAILIYIQNPCSYYASRKDKTFYLPAKDVLRKEIKDLILKMNFSLSSFESNDDLETVEATHSNEAVLSSDLELTMEQELELTLSSECNLISPSSPSLSRANIIESNIRKEMNVYECGAPMGKYLTMTYNTLKAIRPASMEANRAFSATGYIAPKIHSSLGDDTIDMLSFLQKHFQYNTV